jgi:hypothetical protein
VFRFGWLNPNQPDPYNFTTIIPTQVYLLKRIMLKTIRILTFLTLVAVINACTISRLHVQNFKSHDKFITISALNKTNPITNKTSADQGVIKDTSKRNAEQLHKFLGGAGIKIERS